MRCRLLLILGLLSCRSSNVVLQEDSSRADTSVIDSEPSKGDTTVDTVPELEPGDTDADSVPEVEETLPGVQLFDEETVPEFSLEIDEKGMESLRLYPSEYVPADFTYKGRVYHDVGVRTKGSSTWQPIDSKPSLKIKFNEYVEDQSIYDLTEIILNNMVSDYSMMHERVAYRLFRDAGVPAGRAHHAHLTLNGMDYGLFTHVEAATSKMLIPWFDDTSGTMWEFWGSDFEAHYISAFSLKFGKDDREMLERAADALSGNEAFDPERLEESLSLDSFLRYWAVSAVVAQYDGYPYRYPADDAYIYADPTSGQIQFLPHGVDESFYYGEYDLTTGVISRLGWKCLLTKGCPELLEEKIHEALDLIEANDPVTYFDEVREQIAPYVKSDPRKPYSQEYITYYQDYMRNMIDNRRVQLDTILAY